MTPMACVRGVTRTMAAVGLRLACAAFIVVLAGAAPAFASSVLVTLDTSTLAGTSADLAFDLVDGGSPANAVTITKFTTDGTLGAVKTKGNVTGTLPGTVTLADTVFFSEYTQAATLGKSLSFVVSTTGNAPDPGSLPDGFSFFVLDHATGLPLVATTHPTGANALLLLNIGVSELPDIYDSDKIKVCASIRLDSGKADFCDATSYDNANKQTKGFFTDLRRGTAIHADYPNCVLRMNGSAGTAGDMWITLVAPPRDPSPPTFSCVRVGASVTLYNSNNPSTAGFVTNYDATTNRGLFLGLSESGADDRLTLWTFDGAKGTLLATVKTLSLGAKILPNVAYTLELSICNDGTTLAATAKVSNDVVHETMTFSGPIPAGIAAAGQIGIAAQAKSAAADSSVAKFEWGPVK